MASPFQRTAVPTSVFGSSPVSSSGRCGTEFGTRPFSVEHTAPPPRCRCCKQTRRSLVQYCFTSPSATPNGTNKNDVVVPDRQRCVKVLKPKPIERSRVRRLVLLYCMVRHMARVGVECGWRGCVQVCGPNHPFSLLAPQTTLSWSNGPSNCCLVLHPEVVRFSVMTDPPHGIYITPHQLIPSFVKATKRSDRGGETLSIVRIHTERNPLFFLHRPTTPVGTSIQQGRC